MAEIINSGILILSILLMRKFTGNRISSKYHYALWLFPAVYSCGQRAKRACLHAHLATAAGVNTPQLCCVASLMPRQLAAGLLTCCSRLFSPMRADLIRSGS